MKKYFEEEFKCIFNFNYTPFVVQKMKEREDVKVNNTNVIRNESVYGDIIASENYYKPVSLCKTRKK